MAERKSSGEIPRRCAAAAADGHLELYKTSKHFDGEPGRKQRKFPRSKNSPPEAATDD